MRRAVDGIAADSDTGRLADVFDRELVNRLVGQSAGARNNADVAFLMNVTGGDADAAAAGGVGSFTGCDHARTVRSEEAGLATFHGALHANHVFDRDAFGDGDCEIDFGVDAFENGIGGKRRRHKDGGNRGTGCSGGFGYGVEDGNLHVAVFEGLATFAGSDTGDDLGAVVDGEAGVFTAEGTGDALDHDFGIGRN